MELCRWLLSDAVSGGTWRRGQDDKVDSNGVRAGNMTGVDGHHARCLASRRVAGRTTS